VPDNQVESRANGEKLEDLKPTQKEGAFAFTQTGETSSFMSLHTHGASPVDAWGATYRPRMVAGRARRFC